MMQGRATDVWEYVRHPDEPAGERCYPAVYCHILGTYLHLRFLVDSGASGTIVGNRMLHILEKHGRFARTSVIYGVGGKTRSKVYVLPRLVLLNGGRPFYEFVDAEINVLPTDMPFNLLGRDLMSQLDVCLHGERREMTITRLR